MQYVKNILILTLMILAVSWYGVSQSNAQFMSRPSVLSLEAYPPFPTPNSLVTVSLSSYGVDMSDATIDWTIDGVAATSSRGARALQVPMGDGERTTTVTARIVSERAGSQTLTKTLAPGAVDIIIEPQTTAPTGYHGRPLATSDSQIRVVAIPHLFKNGTRIPVSDTRFTWYINGSMILGGAQLGTNVTTVSMPRYGNLEVSVVAESKDGTRTARALATVRPEKPRMVYYEMSSLFGMIMEAPRRFITSKDELSVIAVPYYMNEGIGTGQSLTHSWTEDGNGVSPGIDSRIVTVTRGTGRPSRNIEHTYTSSAYDLVRGVGGFDVTFTSNSNALPTI
jgi:hypothetical protein